MLSKIVNRLKLTLGFLITGAEPIHFRTNIPSITPEEVAEARGFFPMEKFFVFGHARSGTTLLTRLVRIHPEIHCNRQAHFFTRAPLLQGLVADPAVAEWLKRKSFRWNRGTDLSPVVMRAAADFILERDARREKKTIVGDKSPNNLMNGKAVQLMHDVYPDARLIFIVRDGRDAVLSHRFQTFVDATQHLTQKDWQIREDFKRAPEQFHHPQKSLFTEKEIHRAAQGWVSNVMETDTLGRELYGDHYLSLRFEDLLKQPVAILKRVWSFLGSEPDFKGAEAAIEDVLSINLDAHWQEVKAEEIAEAIPKGKKGSWREFFSKRDKEIFRKIAGETLIDWGYEKDLDWQ